MAVRDDMQKMHSESLNRIKYFLLKYAVDFALSPSGRLSNFRISPVLLLHSHKTAYYIHESSGNEIQKLQCTNSCGVSYRHTVLCSNHALIFAANVRTMPLKFKTVEILLKKTKVIYLMKQVQLPKEQRDYHRRQCHMCKDNYMHFPNEGQNTGKYSIN